VEETYLGPDGQPTPSRQGYARVRFQYDHRNNITAVSYRDRNDRPTVSREGFARLTRSYDDEGRLTVETYLDGSGQPTWGRDGFSRVVWAYHALPGWRWKIEVSYQGPAGAPMPHREGYVRRVTVEDVRGDRIEEAYFDGEGKPVLHAVYGYARFRARYDERGNRIEQITYGVDDRPIAMAGHNAGMRWSYDARWNKIEEVWLGADGRIASSRDGFARVVYGYDERGNRIRTEYRDVSGKRIRHARFGYACVSASRDPRGNETDAAYFDEKGKLVSTSVVITSVSQGSAGQRAGVQVNDVLLVWGDEKVSNAPRLRLLLGRRGAQTETTIRVRRQDRTLKLSLPPGPHGLAFGDRAVAPVAESDLKTSGSGGLSGSSAGQSDDRIR
jgi:YD repeat-containing protein